jgi:hypothetical protein
MTSNDLFKRFRLPSLFNLLGKDDGLPEGMHRRRAGSPDAARGRPPGGLRKPEAPQRRPSGRGRAPTQVWA